MSDKWKEFMAELKAIGREAIKDVRQTINEVAFEKPEHAPEPGTPLNQMTQREIYETKHNKEPQKDLDMEL